MEKQIIPVILQVSQQGAQVYFTVFLPKDTAYIQKIQTGVRFLDKLVSNNGTAGTLQLQATGSVNMCYGTDIKIDATQVPQQVLGFNGGTMMLGAPPPFVRWMRQPLVAQQKQIEANLYLYGNEMLYGIYRDDIGKSLNKDLNYVVNVFLHIVLKNQ